MKKNKEAPPQTVFGRSKEFVSLAARLGQKELSKRMRSVVTGDNPVARLKSQIEQAQALVQALGRLKGAAMKVGQLLSIEGKDFLPPEVLQVLSQLQDAAPGMNEAAILEILQNELGPERFAQLSEISPRAVAAASIGQVHSAVYQGRKIALKIQYPGIAESIDTDLSVLRNIVSGLMRFSKRNVPLDDLFQELRTVLLREVDYLEEARQTHFFADLFRPREHYAVPEVIDALCTTHVLALSFEEGMKMQNWLATSPSQDDRNFYGRLALDLYVIEFFEAGRVQTDPNFANFLFRPDERQLVMLDFGATREYDKEFVAEYRKLLRLMREGSDEEILSQACDKMGLLNRTESSECLTAFVAMLRESVEPFNPKRQPFAFGDMDYSQQVRDKSVEFTKLVRQSAPPHQLIFLHRKLGGIFNLLKNLEARLDLGPYWQKLVANSF